MEHNFYINRLPPHIKNALQAMLSMDPRSISEIAKAAEINKSNLLGAMAGNRSIRSELLNSLRMTLALSTKYELELNRAYYFKLGTDLNPLKLLFELNSDIREFNLYWVPPMNVDDLDSEPRSGMYVIHNVLTKSEDGREGELLILLVRDYTNNRHGPYKTLEVNQAQPLSKLGYHRLSWAKGLVNDSYIQLSVEDKSNLMSVFKRGGWDTRLSFIELKNTLFGNQHANSVNWKDVSFLAEKKGVSVIDVMSWLEKNF